MDWNAAIENNRQALKRVLAALVAMTGLAGLTSPLHPELVEGAGEDGSARRGAAEPPAEPGEEALSDCRPTLPRRLHRAVLRLLRPAESAARRLVIVAARELVVNVAPGALPLPRRTGERCQAKRGGVGVDTVPAADRASTRPPSLPLFDSLNLPRRRRPAATSVPRLCVPGYTTPFPVAPRSLPTPRDQLDASRLVERLAALGAALDDLPSHARRFARWQAARNAAGMQIKARNATGVQIKESRDAAASRPPSQQAGERPGRIRFRRVWPLRPGRPPGSPASCSRRSTRREVHDILADIHGLAVWAMERADTS